MLPNGLGRHHTVHLVVFVPLEFFAPFPTSDLPSWPIGRRKQQLLPRGKDGTSQKATRVPEQAHQREEIIRNPAEGRAGGQATPLP